jgi:hypothetical protein
MEVESRGGGGRERGGKREKGKEGGWFYSTVPSTRPDEFLLLLGLSFPK